jgi:hypothetical protein
MSRRKHIVIAFIFASLATFVGSSFTWGMKVTPAINFVLWFPLFVITNEMTDILGTVTEVLVCLIQFPIFAIFFTIGIRRWSIMSVTLTIGCVYALMVLIAWIIVYRHSMG